MSDFDQLANESFFPGNLDALTCLAADLASNNLIGFSGAGISVPLAPSWGGLLHQLISEGVKAGYITDGDRAILTQQTSEDPLEVASSLEEAFTQSRFRSRLSEIFSLGGHRTEAHELLVELPLSSLITLNYDDGLSTAYVHRSQVLPNVIRPDDKYELHRWMVGSTSLAPKTIIHWHGVAAAPDRMVITADDYNRFYGVAENTAFIEELWRTKRLLVVGFGFRDPVLSRLADNVLRNAAGGNQHVGLIGRSDDEPLTPLVRRQFAKKYRLNPVFYRITKGADGREDHSALLEILRAISDSPQPTAPSPSSGGTSKVQVRSPIAKAEEDLKSGLFVGPNGQTLYVEPRLIEPKAASGRATTEVFTDAASIAASGENYIISAPMESGASTLSKRLVIEYLKAGADVYARDVTVLPKYKKALLDDAAFHALPSGQRRVLVLDRYEPIAHERTVKEICGLKCFTTIVFLTRTKFDDITNIRDLGFDLKINELILSYLHRPDIRALATDMYDTFDSDTVSAAVEKTYSDLLELCIPLTPLNVLMYLSVVHREGSFTPLNRLQIMEKFIKDLLHRPSDLYRDSFNADNKIDVISAFVFQLYCKGETGFTRADWDLFCVNDMKASMTWFDKDALFTDLENSRVIIIFAKRYVFKYKLYYAYFVGKYIAQRPSELDHFLVSGAHLNLDSLVEIIAGISKDNVPLVTDLVVRLERSISEFERQYNTGQLDPYSDLEWPDDAQENVKLWEPVADKLTSGPADVAEVDKLKRSIVAESRTADQNVVIREFSDAQRSVTFNQEMLAGAMRESQRLPAGLKMRSMRAIYRSYRIVAQIGFLFAPVIATRQFFVWNNIAFYNAMNWPGYDEADEHSKTALVAGAIPRAVLSRATEDIGSRRLGTVFEHMIDDAQPDGFEALLTFALLLRSKPDGWEKLAKKVLDRVNRNALYLRFMLGAAMTQFNQEVNTNGERSALKRTVAIVQAKRDVRKASPNGKAIGNALKRLEALNYFERNAKAEIMHGVDLAEVEEKANAIVASAPVKPALSGSGETEGDE